MKTDVCPWCLSTEINIEPWYDETRPVCKRCGAHYSAHIDRWVLPAEIEIKPYPQAVFAGAVGWQ